MEFYEVTEKRYSTRKFKSTPVGEEKINNIMECVKSAPTAKNSQPVRIYTVKSAEGIAKANRVSPCVYGAPLVFIVCSDENISWVDGKSHSRGEMDATIAATHLILAATNEGLGSCWVCLFDADKTKAEFALPDNIKPHCLIVCGYSDMEPCDRHFTRNATDVTFKNM